MKRRAIIIGLLALAAWLPSLEPYTAAAEDYGAAHVNTASIAAYWAWLVDHSRTDGAWRIVGLPLIDLARHAHPLGFPVLSIFAHALNGVLLMVWLSRLRVGPMMLLAAPLLFVALPSAIEANMYAVASQSILTTTVFLLLACYLSTALEAKRATAVDIGLCFVAALLGNAIQENLIFTYVALPAAIAYVRRPLRLWDAATIRSVGAYTAATVAAVAAYAAATLEVGVLPTKSPTFNPETLLSFVYYQGTNLIPFELWRHPDLIALAVQHQSILKIAVTILLVAIAVAIARTLERPNQSTTDADIRAREGRLLLAMLLLWISAGLIYVFAGGYSFESRKKYVTLAFSASVIVYLASRALDAARSAGSRRAVIGGMTAAIALSAATTWLIASLWIVEARRGEALVQAIAATPAATVGVRFHPDLYAEWPHWRAVASSQHNAAWVTELEMLRRFNREVTMVEASEPADTVIDCETRLDGPARCAVAPR